MWVLYNILTVMCKSLNIKLFCILGISMLLHTEIALIAKNAIWDSAKNFTFLTGCRSGHAGQCIWNVKIWFLSSLYKAGVSSSCCALSWIQLGAWDGSSMGNVTAANSGLARRMQWWWQLQLQVGAYGGGGISSSSHHMPHARARAAVTA